MEDLTFAVPTLFGLEGLCADEMRRLNLPQVRAENGRVLCSGTWGLFLVEAVITQWPLHSSPKGTPEGRTPSPS